MNINQVFPSKYLNALDLGQAKPVVTIANITMEEANKGEPHKPVLHFVGKDKGMVLNKTNGQNIASIYGPETDAWIGKPITLYTTFVDFQGQSKLALRVEPQIPQANQQPAGALAQPYVPPQVAQTAAPGTMPGDPNAPLADTMPEGPDDLTDDIPF